MLKSTIPCFVRLRQSKISSCLCVWVSHWGWSESESHLMIKCADGYVIFKVAVSKICVWTSLTRDHVSSQTVALLFWRFAFIWTANLFLFILTSCTCFWSFIICSHQSFLFLFHASCTREFALVPPNLCGGPTTTGWWKTLCVVYDFLRECRNRHDTHLQILEYLQMQGGSVGHRLNHHFVVSFGDG